MRLLPISAEEWARCLCRLDPRATHDDGACARPSLRRMPTPDHARPFGDGRSVAWDVLTDRRLQRLGHAQASKVRLAQGVAHSDTPIVRTLPPDQRGTSWRPAPSPFMLSANLSMKPHLSTSASVTRPCATVSEVASALAALSARVQADAAACLTAGATSSLPLAEASNARTVAGGSSGSGALVAASPQSTQSSASLTLAMSLLRLACAPCASAVGPPSRLGGLMSGGGSSEDVSSVVRSLLDSVAVALQSRELLDLCVEPTCAPPSVRAPIPGATYIGAASPIPDGLPGCRKAPLLIIQEAPLGVLSSLLATNAAAGAAEAGSGLRTSVLESLFWLALRTGSTEAALLVALGSLDQMLGRGRAETGAAGRELGARLAPAEPCATVLPAALIRATPPIRACISHLFANPSACASVSPAGALGCS